MVPDRFPIPLPAYAIQVLLTGAVFFLGTGPLPGEPPTAAGQDKFRTLSLEQWGNLEVPTVSKGPERPWKTPVAIYVVTRDDTGSLDALVANETMRGRRIVVKRLNSPSGEEHCQIVFLGQSEEPKMARDLAGCKRQPALTVSAIPSFLACGGMIQFLIENTGVRCAANRPAARETGLALSSELLKAALYVDSKSAGEAS